QPPGGSAIAARYTGGNMLPDPGQRLGGTVDVHFDPQQPRYSVDNTAGSAPVPGWADGSSGRTSVPPYSVSLVMQVQVGGRSETYEAILQRRWPYVLATRAPIGLLGASEFVGSQVKGPILVFPMPRSDPETPLTPPQVVVVEDVFEKLEAAGAVFRTGTVSVGGFLNGVGPSHGNRLKGRADFTVGCPSPAADSINVFDPPRNQFDGTVREDLPGRVRDSTGMSVSILDQILQPPNVQNLVTVRPGQQIRTGAFSSFHYLNQDTLFTSRTPPSGFAGEVHQGARFVVPGSMGNRFIPSSPGQAYEICSSSLQIDNAILQVNGNLDMARDPGDSGSVRLSGVNSTLIVNGVLSVDEASLDGQDQGMVIYCQALVARSAGTFNGLILVQQSAIFYVDQRIPGGLTVNGGIVCGGLPLRAVQSTQPDPNLPPVVDTTKYLDFNGLTIFSAALNYAPAYLRTVHQYGDFHLLSLRRLE
ncbi:MAG: hypothetical protein AB1758_23335, partial [Candidatus Eremiobacterota bacterium]